MTLAIAAGLLAAVGAWLVIRGGAVRLILGFILLGHAANLVIISAGVTDRRAAPITGAELDRMVGALLDEAKPAGAAIPKALVCPRSGRSAASRRCTRPAATRRCFPSPSAG